MAFLVVVLGLLLRLSFINKTEGLWNDEYVSWMVANTTFSDGFWSEVIKQCHMPLYYLYLKPFSDFSDVVLRLTSVIPSVIGIYIMYLIGKEYSKKIGIFSALITSVLSFLIYYAQEVRFYSLLFLFSSISLLFTIKLLKQTNKITILGYIISLLFVIFTHILGIMYALFNILYVVYKKKSFSKKVLLGIFILCLIMFPIGMHVLSMLPSSQWWGKFSYTNILFLFSDYLSPILTNNVNAPPVFFYNSAIVFWITVPTIIGCIGLFSGIKQNKGLFYIAFSYVFILCVLAILGKLVFITKYSIEILPIIILLVSNGFSNLKNFGTVLLSTFVFLHLACLYTPHYVTKQVRMEGHKIVGDILEYRDAQNIIFTYYEPNRFLRYIDLNGKKTKYISKINRFEFLDNPSSIQNNIKKGETVSFVFLDSVSFFPDEYMQIYGNLPEMFVTFSKIKNSLIKTIDLNYTDYKIDKAGSWTIITAMKK